MIVYALQIETHQFCKIRQIMDHINSLPKELNSHITSYLDKASLMQLAATSRNQRDSVQLFDHLSKSVIQRLPKRIGILSVNAHDNREEIISELSSAIDKVAALWASIYSETKVYDKSCHLQRASQLSQELSFQWQHKELRDAIMSVDKRESDFFYMLHNSLLIQQLELLTSDENFSYGCMLQCSIIAKLDCKRERPSSLEIALKQLAKVVA